MLGLIVGIELAFFKAMGDLEAFTVSWGYEDIVYSVATVLFKEFSSVIFNFSFSRRINCQTTVKVVMTG